MFATTHPLARAVSIGVLGIALLDPCSVRAQSTSDPSRSEPSSQSGVTAADADEAELVLAEPEFRVLNLPSHVRLVYGRPLYEGQAVPQGRDGLLNGAVIGAAVGAGIGIAVTHGVRDSDLVFGQYARGALIFAAMGAGVGVGIDALFNRVSSGPTVKPRRVSIAPAVWRDFAGVAAKWRW